MHWGGNEAVKVRWGFQATISFTEFKTQNKKGNKHIFLPIINNCRTEFNRIQERQNSLLIAGLQSFTNKVIGNQEGKINKTGLQPVSRPVVVSIGHSRAFHVVSVPLDFFNGVLQFLVESCS